ncbi:hypothetical protein LTR78_006436 [Recurvomyces mirabilis]|uniref:F-box domain-containing protein n=1 Tax=Recurvomyces mirabilis TaxID=574656 RepID=A0AAE0WKR1_9PEZI|nr:hypothetical protein LTR78_006436 [Recurvomyces mirabilis]KAK5151145.1 hypothetical protein LTS14_009641 [Recurvomyces mirabilis]
MESTKQIMARKVTSTSIAEPVCGFIAARNATRRLNKAPGYDVLATVELCEPIFEHLPVIDLLQAPLVCRDFCATIRDSTKLQQLLLLRPRAMRAQIPQSIASRILTTDGRYLEFDIQHGEPNSAKPSPEIVYQHNPCLLHLESNMQQLNLHQARMWKEYDSGKECDAGARLVLTTTHANLLDKIYSPTVRRMFLCQPPTIKIKLLLLRNGSRHSRWKNWHVVTHEVTNESGVTFGQVVDEFRQLHTEVVEPGVVQQNQDFILCYVVFPEDNVVRPKSGALLDCWRRRWPPGSNVLDNGPGQGRIIDARG